jgi:hypothetical protein
MSVLGAYACCSLGCDVTSFLIASSTRFDSLSTSPRVCRQLRWVNHRHRSLNVVFTFIHWLSKALAVLARRSAIRGGATCTNTVHQLVHLCASDDVDLAQPFSGATSSLSQFDATPVGTSGDGRVSNMEPVGVPIWHALLVLDPRDRLYNDVDFLVPQAPLTAQHELPAPSSWLEHGDL